MENRNNGFWNKDKFWWQIYLKVLPFLVIPFVFGTFLGAMALAKFAFGASNFLAIVYGIIVLTITISLVFGMNLLYKRKAGDSFIASGPESQKKLQEFVVETYRSNSRKNIKSFYGTAAIVAVISLVFAALMYKFFGLYPSEVFRMPLVAFIIMWVVLIRFLPRWVIYLLLVTAPVFQIVIVLMGPAVLLQLLPYLLIFPLMMFMNFFIMFGPLLFFNIRQIEIHMPGEAGWGKTFDDIRGQPEAKRQLERALRLAISEKGEELMRLGGQKPRGILMIGPPGVGKTLWAKAAATVLGTPIVITNGAAFMATFIGIDIITMIYLKWRTESLAKGQPYLNPSSPSKIKKPVIVFIDEAEVLLQRRSGMQGDSGHHKEKLALPTDPWQVFEYDSFGRILGTDIMVDTESSRKLFWEKKFSRPVHQMMFPGMGMGQMSMAIFPFLTWLDGMGSPPANAKLVRGQINGLLDILFVPTFIGKKRMRFSPAKPVSHNVLFLAATNRPQVLDPAMLRPGRFGLKVYFKTPGEVEREDIADLYFGKVAHDSELDLPERRKEFARTTAGLSPAQIEQVVRDAISFKFEHIEKLKELKQRLEAREKLSEEDQWFWGRYKDEIGLPDWDKTWATWNSLMESLGAIRYGVAQPTRTNKKSQGHTAFHEFGGHVVPLKGFCSKFMKPGFVTIMPRGEALGLVDPMKLDEREDYFQRMAEGTLRMTLGSPIAEELFLPEKEHGPGVVSDLMQATRLACAMAGLWGMTSRKCSEKDAKKYEEIGESLISLAEALPPSMAGAVEGGGVLIGSIIGSPKKRKEVAMLLGQAYVDDYRLLVKNKEKIPPVVDLLLQKIELVGKELEDVWNNLELVPLTQEDLVVWPEMKSENPFYKQEFWKESPKEGEAK